MIPDDLQYTQEHEWVRRSGGEPLVRIGITDHAQGALGDVVFVSLPAEGDAVTTGEPMGEVESTKSVSEVYAPVTGTVRARNGRLDDEPDLVNTDPYGDGWLIEIAFDAPGDGDVLGGLLDADGYAALIETQA